MEQTENTAIVLRYANYRDNDRMLTLFSPVKGKIDCLCRGCRRPRSPLVNASEIFALGDYELYEKNGRYTVTSVSMIETFYPLRLDYDRLSVASYMAELTENVIQPGESEQQLFLLLLHALSRLAFSSQPWNPLLTGFLMNFSAVEGFKPRLNHCCVCGRRIGEEHAGFSQELGGVVCRECESPGQQLITAEQLRFMRNSLTLPSAKWVDTEDANAPLYIVKKYVEGQIDCRLRTGDSLPM